MKFLLMILLISTRGLGYSQTNYDPVLRPIQQIDTILTEILLNDTINPLHCDLWENGDYKIFIETETFVAFLMNEHSGIIREMHNTMKNDSTAYLRYHMYGERYRSAIMQLLEAESGFDLRSLAVYVGPENDEMNKGNSATVELFVRQFLENGNAAVFYKGQRIFKLYKKTTLDPVMSIIRIYFDDDTNYAFQYFGYINW